MNIALVGYGKMGQAIEHIAQSRGHVVVYRITEENRQQMAEAAFGSVDVVIEFTGPDSALQNVLDCLKMGLPVVSGSTGWKEGLLKAGEACIDNDTAFLYSSNFSVGVQLFFALNEKLAQLMAPHPEYAVKMQETHHTEKKDAPSGTAVTLAEDIVKNNSRYHQWHLGMDAEKHSIPIEALRVEGVPGTHLIQYDSAIDGIEIRHTAYSREGFALGAVLAAEYLAGKKGIYSMQDVLDWEQP